MFAHERSWGWFFSPVRLLCTCLAEVFQSGFVLFHFPVRMHIFLSVLFKTYLLVLPPLCVWCARVCKCAGSLYLCFLKIPSLSFLCFVTLYENHFLVGAFKSFIFYVIMDIYDGIPCPVVLSSFYDLFLLVFSILPYGFCVLFAFIFHRDLKG